LKSIELSRRSSTIHQREGGLDLLPDSIILSDDIPAPRPLDLDNECGDEALLAPDTPAPRLLDLGNVGEDEALLLDAGSDAHPRLENPDRLPGDELLLRIIREGLLLRSRKGPLPLHTGDLRRARLDGRNDLASNPSLLDGTH
jgi:hypothetical protein